jgi:hypothetical protein
MLSHIDREVTTMANMQSSYSERLEKEIQQVPDEYMPALLNIVHAFREGVIQKSLEESFKRSWAQAQAGETYPIGTLWDEDDTHDH